VPLFILEPSVYQISPPFLSGPNPSSHSLLSGNLTVKGSSSTCLSIICNVGSFKGLLFLNKINGLTFLMDTHCGYYDVRTEILHISETSIRLQECTRSYSLWPHILLCNVWVCSDLHLKLQVRIQWRAFFTICTQIIDLQSQRDPMISLRPEFINTICFLIETSERKWSYGDVSAISCWIRQHARERRTPVVSEMDRPSVAATDSRLSRVTAPSQALPISHACPTRRSRDDFWSIS
jgi:hypothetical protein